EDIGRIEAEYERGHGATKAVLQNRQDVQAWLNELDQQQSALNQALDGLDDLETFYDGLVKRYQHLRDEATDKKRKLLRDFDDCKRQAIRIQQGLKRSQFPN